MTEQEDLGEDARISDVSEIEPRRLRYSEEVLPLHWSDAVQPGKCVRPLKVCKRGGLMAVGRSRPCCRRHRPTNSLA